MTTPTSPIAAVKLLREARTTLEMWRDVAPAVSLCADIDRFFAASIEQPTSEAVAWRIAYAPGAQLPAFSMGDPYFTEVKPLDDTVFSAGTVITPLYSVPPANSTDAQKLATLREGLHELGWCAEFGALAKEVLDGAAEVEGARSFCASRPEDMPKYVQPEPLQWDEPAGASIDERAPDLDTAVKFLLGEAPINGLWFGDADIDHSPRQQFWWRSYLRAMLQQHGLADKGAIAPGDGSKGEEGREG